MISGLNHVSIAVPDLRAAIEMLVSRYGLTAGETRTNEAQGVRLAWVELGNARLELMEPMRADSPVARFLERNPGGGIHHFCLDVDALEASVQTLRARGARVLGDGAAQRNVHGDRIAFLHPKDFLGALVELEERPGGAGDRSGIRVGRGEGSNDETAAK
ncbi:MAG: methylmalonyl-CoA epimerase [Betaproteobacteria bacterium]|nr:MAG: methylmalonyl-CoA epimerase [Betaproteobacteria bacterium]